MLRACAIEALVDAHRAELARQEDPNAQPVTSEDAAFAAYSNCRCAFQQTLQHAHKAAIDNEQHNLAAPHRKRANAADHMCKAWNAAFLLTKLATTENGVQQKLLPKKPTLMTVVTAAGDDDEEPTPQSLRRTNNAPPTQLPPSTLVIYTDGSGPETRRTRSDDMPAGWGFVVLHGGDGKEEPDAVEVHSKSGKVIVNEQHDADFLGAERPTNNTAELSAIAHALRYAISDQSGRPVLIRFDSKYAGDMTVGRRRSRSNKVLVRNVQRLWQRAKSHLKGLLWCSHVYGHSNHKWNDRADELAKRGKSGAGVAPRRRRQGVG